MSDRLTLTRAQRADLFAGRWPKITGLDPCPVERGDVYRLSSRLSLRVTAVHHSQRTPGQWSLSYELLNQRADVDLYLLPCSHSIPLGEDGRPAPMSEAEAHGMTTDRRRALEPVAVPTEVQTVLTMQARDRDARRALEEERVVDTHRQTAERAGRQLRDVCTRMARLGLDPTPLLADLQRRLKELEAEMQDDAA